MSSEFIDLLAKKFANATQNRPVYVAWVDGAFNYTADDAAAFLQYGDESAPTLSDALFDEAQLQDMALDRSVLYWLQESSNDDEIFEIVDEAGVDGFDEDLLAREIAERVKEAYFDDVRFDESEFFNSVEGGILTYGALLTAGDPDYVLASEPELEDAEALLELANANISIAPERLLQAMQEVSDDFYSLWCVVSMPKHVLLDAFHGSKTVEVSAPTIYVGNYGLGAYFGINMSGTLKIKLDDMSPYFQYLNEYIADEID